MRPFRRVLAPAALALAAMAVLAGGAQADSNAIHIRGIQPGGFPTVGVTVAVPHGISSSDITVDENGSPAKVLSVRPLLVSGGEIDVLLALDTSNSMSQALPQAVAAARQLVSTLPSGVPIGLVTFSDQTRVLQPLTGDHSRVVAALASVTTTQSGTVLYDAMAKAAGLFEGSAQHNVVVLSDGTDTGSRNRLESAVARLKGARVTVFSVGLGGSKTSFPQLQDLSAATNGTFSGATPEALNALYAQLGDRLSHQYLVQYRSRSAPGAQITITVHALGESDSSTVLLPRSPLLPGDAGPGRALLTDWWGLLLVLSLTFGAAFAIGSFLFGARARKARDQELARRMMAVPPDQNDVPARPDTGMAAWIPEPFVQVGTAVAEVGGFKGSLDTKLERAGLPITSGEIVGASVLAALAGLLIGWFAFTNVLVALPLGGIFAYVPFYWLSRKMKHRVNALHSQLPDVLMILASSIRAGHSFLQALDTVAKEIGEPSAAEFARVVTEIRLGRPFDQALTALAERVGTDEFKWAMLGVNVHREVGGNLAEILDTLAESVRERENVRRQVKVLSAEGRMSVKILIAMPFLIGAYLAWVNTEYMKLLWTTHLGLTFLAVGGVLMVVGYFWSRKVVRFDV
jgi:tight adherence protein B